MIGKGKRSQSVKDAMRQYKSVYFGATGGAGALLSKCVLSSEVIAFEELGPEAVRKLEVKDLPLFVINDIYGSDLYVEGIQKYKR
jgi:fumarate hydratase subunit beta